MKALLVTLALLVVLLAGGLGWLFFYGGNGWGVVDFELAGALLGTKKANEPMATAEGGTEPVEEAAVDEAEIGGPSRVEDLIELSPHGPLPRIAADGRRPSEIYAGRSAHSGDRPLIAVILTDMGLMEERSRAAVDTLPSSITFAFSPYAAAPGPLVERARAGGHELLLSIPMEPRESSEDPGPDALLTTYSDAENLLRFKALLGRMTGYVGIITQMGSRFTTNSGALRTVLEEARDRGLLVVDSGTASDSLVGDVGKALRLPTTIVDHVIDDVASASAIDLRLRDVEEIARSKGTAVALGSARPVTLERVAAWLPGLTGKGLVAAPLTGVLERQERQ